MMVKRILVLFFVFLWLNQVILAQSSPIIVSNDGQPLPYATVINMRTGKGVFASADGKANLDNIAFFKTGDTIKITYTGYSDTLIKLPINEARIVLKPEALELEPVAVYPCQNSMLTKIKNYKKFPSNQFLGMSSGVFGSWAAFIPNSGRKNAILQTITIELNFFSIPPNARNAPYKFRLLQYDTISGMPGKQLVSKEWVVHPTGKKLILKIADENIRLPKLGIVVAIDFFYAGEQYTYPREFRMMNSDGSFRDTVKTYYGTNILAVGGQNLLGKGFSTGNNLGKWSHYNSKQTGWVAPLVILGIKECN
jgi:hypothetical protein